MIFLNKIWAISDVLLILTLINLIIWYKNARVNNWNRSSELKGATKRLDCLKIWIDFVVFTSCHNILFYLLSTLQTPLPFAYHNSQFTDIKAFKVTKKSTNAMFKFLLSLFLLLRLRFCFPDIKFKLIEMKLLTI